MNAFSTLVCNKDRLVAVGFGEGYIGFYHSNLPHSKPPPKIGSRLWRSPLWLVLVVLVVVWQFSRGGGAGNVGQHLGSHWVDAVVGRNAPIPSPPLPHSAIKYRGFEDSVGGDRRDWERKLRGKREVRVGDKGERIPQL